MVDVLADALREWEETKFTSPVIVRKGQNPLTEHYSAVKAEVLIEGNPETDVNQDLVKELQLFDQIVVAGEALSHCLANTVSDLIKNDVNPKKIIILSDCTTSVPMFEELGKKFQTEMELIGVRFMTTEEFNV
jgi:nicotinamidase-related amidase